MKHLELISKLKQSYMYHIRDYSEVSDKLIESVEWPDSVPDLFFDFKPFSPAGGLLKHRVSRKYYVRYILGGKRSALKPIGRAMKDSPIEIRPPRSVAELRKYSKATINEDYIKPYKRHMDGSFEKEVRGYLARVGETKSMLLFKGGKNVGLVSIAHSVRWDRKPVSIVTWLFVKETLPPAEKKDAYFKLYAWLKKNCREYLAWYTHDFSTEEQKLCHSLGLKPYRVFFHRRLKKGRK